MVTFKKMETGDRNIVEKIRKEKNSPTFFVVCLHDGDQPGTRNEPYL